MNGSIQRSVLLTLFTVVTLTVAGSGAALHAEETSEKARVIILGFDGADPNMIRHYNADPINPLLPNLARLAKQGTFRDLGTAIPAQSPVSWASFATGFDPGNTGIFDFLRNDFGNGKSNKRKVPTPSLGLGIPTLKKFSELPEYKQIRCVLASTLLGLLVLSFLITKLIVKARFVKSLAMSVGVTLLLGVAGYLILPVLNKQFGWIPENIWVAQKSRDGYSFWKLLDNSNIQTTMLNMPVTFPANSEPLTNGGRLLTGLGTPDVRKHWGSFTLFVDQPYKGGKKSTETGGSIVTVMTSGGEGTAYIKGLDPIDADLKGAKKKAMIEKTRTEVAFVISRAEKTVGLTVGGNPVPTLHEGEWSDWVEMTFPLTPIITLHGMAKFQLISTSPLQLYMSPINFHPKKLPSAAAITYPPEMAKELFEELGCYCTIGWPIPSNPLKDEVLDEGAFMTEVRVIAKTRERIMNYELQKNDWQVFTQVYMFTDRVQHMMWRLIDDKSPRYDKDSAIREQYADSIFKSYKMMDQIIGRVMDNPAYQNDILMVVSDHGFGPFRRGLNINTWLIKAGFMGMLNQEADLSPMELEDLFKENKEFFSNTDWAKTRAYSLGLGNVYLNLRGREPKGIVEPTDRQATEQQIIDGLLALRDFGDLRPPIANFLKALSPREGKETKFYEPRYRVEKESGALIDQLELHLLPPDAYAELDEKLLALFDSLNEFSEPESFATARAGLAGLLKTTVVDQDPAYEDRRVVSSVFRRDLIYKGQAHRLDAPNLILGFRSGWRVSWQTALGGAPAAILEDNTQTWSGDHCSTDPKFVSGIFFCNRDITVPDATDKPLRIPGRVYIKDIAPTMLHYFGLQTTNTVGLLPHKSVPTQEQPMDGVPFEFK